MNLGEGAADWEGPDVVVVLRVVDVVGRERGDAVLVRLVDLEVAPVERLPVSVVWVGSLPLRIGPVVEVLCVLARVRLLASSPAHPLLAAASFADDGTSEDRHGRSLT